MPIYNELASIILKTEGVAKELQDSLSEIGVEVAFIYGSFASGKAGVDSDIDIFIIGEVDEDNLIIKIREVEKKLSREINYVLFTAKEFEMFSKGYRPSGRNQHISVVMFAELFLRKEDVIILDRMRRKRHATIYDTAGTISEKEAENAVERAEKLVHEIERMLKGDKP